MTERKNRLVDFVKWAAVVAGSAGLGAVTVHFVEKKLREREARRELPEGLEDELLAPQETPALAQATTNPTAIMTLPMVPVLPSMIPSTMMPQAAMPGMSPLGPSPELASLRQQHADRQAQREREKVERERVLADIQRRFMEDDD